MMRRAAIELSSTFIIVLILSLVVFASGIAIAYRVMHKADEYSGEIDRETEQRIEDILAPGERVALPIDRKPLRIGKSHVFGLGIFNMLGAEQEFEVRMSFHKAIDAAANADIAPQGISAADIKDYINKNWVFSRAKRYTIRNNDKEKIPLIVSARDRIAAGVPTLRGTYVFNVCVCQGICEGAADCTSSITNFYDGHIRKVYVDVS